MTKTKLTEFEGDVWPKSALDVINSCRDMKDNERIVVEQHIVEYWYNKGQNVKEIQINTVIYKETTE